MMGSLGLLALALTAVPVQESFGRFKLFNNCETMFLLVGVADDNEHVKNVGLTKERVQFAVESRLRGARLFRSGFGSPVLEVNVDVVGSAFFIHIRYNKTLFDPVSDRTGFAPTWEISSFGTHGQTRAEFILSSLSGILDKFLTEYLRVNESACTGSPQPPTQ